MDTKQKCIHVEETYIEYIKTVCDVIKVLSVKYDLILT